MSTFSNDLIRFIQREFRKLADPEKAPPMAAYMKTERPFYGIQKPARAAILRLVKKRFAPKTRRDYEAAVLALWRLPHREEQYAALDFASQWPLFIVSESLPLYERLIREGAWWDLVDPAATGLAGRVLLKERPAVRKTIGGWIDDENLWIRRAALLSQIRHKEKTDERQLFRHCLQRAHETEFFIRKGIGWALRDYSYTAPEAVRDFLLTHRDRLSGLSFREGAKQLARTRRMRL